MRKILSLILSLVIIIPSSFIFSGKVDGGEPEQILRAAVQNEMKTRNVLNANDVWTYYVLGQCYDSVLKIDPKTEKIVPYILTGFEQGHNKQIDAEDRILPPESVGFLPMPEHNQIHPELLPPKTEADPDKHEIIAYYDFTGVMFHDGEQVDILDVVFSYYLLALHPDWYTGVAPLMDAGGLGGNFSIDRWLGIWDVSNEYSDDNNPLTSALSFHLSTNYAQIWVHTMNVPLFPQHIWESTGYIIESDVIIITDIHIDFGFMIDSNGIGVPTDHPTLKEFDLTAAMDWEPKNDEIIGTGMFKFKEFIPGSHARLVDNEDYLEMETGGLSIHRPYIDGIEFIKYSTTQQATMALRKGMADIILWSIPPDFIPEVQSDPNVALISIPEPGFFYLAFNMRTAVFGYPNNDPTQGDTGEPLRKAIAHLIDKKTIVDYYLQGYGTMADGPVGPRNTFWYNSTLPKYNFSTSLAGKILDANGYIDNDGDGWRDIDPTIPGDQDDKIELLAPTADYDPIRAQKCLLIESVMTVKLKDDTGAGINLFCNHQSFGTIVSRIENRDFEMYTLGWHIEDIDPGYLFNLFYSKNAENGQNYPGYSSAQFDEVILASRSEMDVSKRQMLIKWAQGIVVEDLPIIVLYYQDNIYAYRSDRFTGWIVYKFTIFNYWSLMNIGSRSEKSLRATITVASAVSSNKTETITVTVRDQDRNVVKDATVNVTVDFGNLRAGGMDYGSFWDGLTNLNGQAIIDFVAPYVTTENGTKISITVKATKRGYDDSGIKSTFITVFPPEIKFLSVTIDLKYGDLINEYESTEIDVLVKDEKLQPIDGVFVDIRSSPTDLYIEPSNSTTSNGGRIKGILLTAPDVDRDTLYIIRVGISKPGYKAINGTIELIVLNGHIPRPSPPFPPFALLLLAIIFMLVTAILVKLQKPKEKPKR